MSNKINLPELPKHLGFGGTAIDKFVPVFLQEIKDQLEGFDVSVNPLNFKGGWDADANDPELSDDGGGGDANDFYIVETAGSSEIDGINDWQLKDWIINTGEKWVKIDNTDLVVSICDKTGVVTLDGEDIDYDNTTSGLTAEEVQAAIDEIVTLIPSVSNFISQELIDAKGDLLVGSSDNTVAKLSAGSNGQFLQSDDTQVNGVKWADVSSTEQTYYVANNGAELDAAIVALNSVGGGIIQLAGPDISYSPADNRNISNIHIIGSTTGIAMTKITFNNANYWYGDNINLSHIRIDPYLTNPVIKLVSANAAFMRLDKIQHRGSPVEFQIDADIPALYMWAEQVVSCKFKNSSNTTAYLFDNSNITFEGGTVYIDDTSTSSGQTTQNLMSVAEKNSYNNSGSGLSAINVQNAIDEVNTRVTVLGARTYEDQVLHDVKALGDATPDVVLTGTAAGDLQTALDNLNEGEILQIDTSAVYSPILLPATNGIKVKVGDGFLPSITGANCIKIPDGLTNQIISGILIENCTTARQNEYGAGIALEHQAKFDNLIFWNITIQNVLSGSGVMLSYHQSISGDNYATASLLSEMSTKLAFVDCFLHKAVNEKIEGASIAVRGINKPYFHKVHCDSQDQGRGISLQNCINILLDGNKIINTQDGNGGEAIKVDAIGSPSGYTNTGIIKNNICAYAIEGIDLDDMVDALVYNNTTWNCTGDGISFDDSAVSGVALNNICFNSENGIRIESGAIDVFLKKNVCFNNTTNYNVPVAYTLCPSNSNTMMDMFNGSNSIPFVADTPANWATSVPLNALDAINRIANDLATLAGAPIS